MNRIRSLLILSVLLTCAFGENYEKGLKNSNLMIDNREVEAFGSAVSSILHKTVNEFLIVRIVIFRYLFDDDSSGQKNNEFNREISAILRSIHGMFVVEVVEADHFFKNTNEQFKTVATLFKGTCLIFFENLEAYKNRIFRRMKNVNSGIMIMFIHGSTADEVLQFWQEVDNKFLGDVTSEATTNEYIIVDTDNGHYELLEINPFVGDGDCSKTSMVRINRFSKTSMEWEKPLEQFKMRETFNGCKVNFYVQPDQVNVKKTPEGREECSGMYIDIMKSIAELGSFKPTYVIIPTLNIHDSGEGLAAEYVAEDVAYKTNEMNMLQVIAPSRLVNLVEKELYFVVPQGELYTEWEKLFLAFDEVTWLLIVLTFAASFAVIIIISNFAPQFVKNFVFGRDVSTPALNVLKIFFGLGQMVLPGRNFARFLLTLFLIWTLIFRTCYQGLLFEFMIGDGRKPPIKTIDEMLERNFTYHVHYMHCIHLTDTNVTGKGK